MIHPHCSWSIVCCYILFFDIAVYHHQLQLHHPSSGIVHCSPYGHSTPAAFQIISQAQNHNHRCRQSSSFRQQRRNRQQQHALEQDLFSTKGTAGTTTPPNASFQRTTRNHPHYCLRQEGQLSLLLNHPHPLRANYLETSNNNKRIMLDIGRQSEETGLDIHHGDIDRTTASTTDDRESFASSVVTKHDAEEQIIRMIHTDVDNDAKHRDKDDNNRVVNDNSKSHTRTTTKRPLSLPPPPPHYNTRAELKRDDDDDDDDQEGINVNDNSHNEGKNNIKGNEEDIHIRGRRRRRQQPGPKHCKSSSPQLSPPWASFPIMSSSSSLSCNNNNNNIIHTSNKNVNGKDDDEDKSILKNNLNLSTKDKHGVAHKKFYGPYKHIRASLDYDYHGNYSKSRQELQDAIVNKLLDGTMIHDTANGRVCKTPTEPWIVFTAGVMGAGKSHTMKQLASQGLFPLQSFVVVDPDEIRSNFPEYHLYAKECPKVAGELTHTEAGYVTEITTEAALQQGHNVLVDGSLRDYAWYRGYFKSLREEYGGLLRIAVLHITAPREVVLERAANRAKHTGRVVPVETIEKALEQVPISVKKLAPLADFFCELDNSQCTSSGGEVEIRTTPGITWDTFRDNWAQTCPWAPVESGGQK